MEGREGRGQWDLRLRAVASDNVRDLIEDAKRKDRPEMLPREMTLIMIVALAFGAACPLRAMPSHLRPHLYDYAPPALLEPLDASDPRLLKGWSMPDEERLLQSLGNAALAEKVIKIAVYKGLGCKVAAVKLQAGEWATGRFSLATLNEDALKVLRVAFDGPDRCDHLDLWAAVPLTGAEQVRWHWPVFSLSTWRRQYDEIGKGDVAPVEALGKLGLIRYDPVLLRNASDRDDMAAQALTLGVPDLSGRGERAGGETRNGDCSALRSGAVGSRTVAITIDDGPHPVIATLMVKVLAEEGVRATFFVVGEKALQHPQLLREIVEGGNEVGNHTFTHRRLPDVSPDVARAELKETARLIEAISGRRCRLMRPPGGDMNAASLAVCHELDLLPVFWTRNTGDWRDRPVREVVAKALKNVRAGDVILIHQARPESAEALREIILGLRRLGLRPGCVGDLLQGAPLIRGRAPAVIAQLQAKGALVRE
jgi:peptidoglycan/xylan/chitin deacetylase (PgdA/CDA1 family)